MTIQVTGRIPELREAVPDDCFKPLFKAVRQNIRATSVAQFLTRLPRQVPAVSLFVWDEMVHRGKVKKPHAIAPIINNNYRGIYEFVARELGDAPLRDAYSIEFFNEIDEEVSFAEIGLVQCFPEDIHIVDVEFSDNRHPIRRVENTAGHRRYHGLHIFGEFISRLNEVAKHRGVRRISLMVAEPPLHDVFAAHGFAVSKTEMSKRAFQVAGHGYPMIRAVT